MTALDILRPFIWEHFGDDVADPRERLEAFRTVIPGTLPDDYAETLLELRRATALEQNYVDSIERAHPRIPGEFVEVGPRPPLDILYGLQASHTNVFEAWRQLAWRMPPDLVPIGRDGGGSQICIDVSEAGNGRIFHWFIVGDPGPSDANGRPGWGNVFLLADSFTDLCRRLRHDDEPPRSIPGARICFSRL